MASNYTTGNFAYRLGNIKHPNDLQKFNSKLNEKTEIEDLKEKYKVYYYMHMGSFNNFLLLNQKKDKT